jgi:mannosyl-oligosaccharide alpha-1,2-mannosidase
MYKAKALDLGNRLLPAFETKSGIPKAMVNLQTYVARPLVLFFGRS